jgi:hypothetical protein
MQSYIHYTNLHYAGMHNMLPIENLFQWNTEPILSKSVEKWCNYNSNRVSLNCIASTLDRQTRRRIECSYSQITRIFFWYPYQTGLDQSSSCFLILQFWMYSSEALEFIYKTVDMFVLLWVLDKTNSIPWQKIR